MKEAHIMKKKYAENMMSGGGGETGDFPSSVCTKYFLTKGVS